MNFDDMVANAMNAAKLYAEKTGNQVSMPKQRRTTPIKINHQGDVKLWHDCGYCVVGGPDAVCFYIDVDGYAYVSGWTTDHDNCPMIYVGDNSGSVDTVVSFPEFKGWRVHATNDGKTLAVALVREGTDANPDKPQQPGLIFTENTRIQKLNKLVAKIDLQCKPVNKI